MRRQISANRVYSLILVLPFIFLASSINVAQPIQSVDNNRVHLGQFDMLSATSGWVLLGQDLFWTHDAGQTWKETGPFIPADAVVMDVEFINSEMGWMLFSTIDPNGYL